MIYWLWERGSAGGGLRGVEALLPMVPGLTEVLPDLAAPPRADADTERYALFDAVVALLGFSMLAIWLRQPARVRAVGAAGAGSDDVPAERHFPTAVVVPSGA